MILQNIKLTPHVVINLPGITVQRTVQHACTLSMPTTVRTSENAERCVTSVYGKISIRYFQKKTSPSIFAVCASLVSEKTVYGRKYVLGRVLECASPVHHRYSRGGIVVLYYTVRKSISRVRAAAMDFLFVQNSTWKAPHYYNNSVCTHNSTRVDERQD